MRFLHLFLAISLCTVLHSIGQVNLTPTDYHYIDFLTIEDGLSQSNVNCIIQDHAGYIWIGTDEGLNRYNGYEFKIFNYDPNKSNSLLGNFITFLYEDSQERLWVGLTEGGLNLYDPLTETFKNWKHSRTDSNSLYIGNVFSIIEDKHQNLWITTYNGITYFNLEKNEFQRIRYDKSDDILGENPTSYSVKYKNKIIAARNVGLSIIDTENKDVENLYFDDFPLFQTLSPSIETMIVDDYDHLWIGTSDFGLYIFDLQKKTLQKFIPKNNPSIAIPEIIWSSEKDSNGDLYFGTDGKGIIIINPLTHEISQLQSINYPSITNENVKSIYRDNANNLWIGTYGNGVLLINRNRKRFVHYQYFDDHMKSSDKNSILSITKDKNDDFWLGTDGSGLYKYDPAKRKFTNFNALSSEKLSGDVIKSLAYDKNDNLLYAGTYNKGLNIIDLTNFTVKKYTHHPNDSLSINSNNIWSILIDKDERVWLATLNGGLDEYLPTQKKFIHHTFNVLNIQSISSNHLSTLFEDRSGNIWVGASGSAINKYDKKRNHFTKYYTIHAQDTFKQISDPNEIFEDSNHTIWILTQSGIGIYDEKNDEIIGKFMEKEALAYPQSMLEDYDGNFWVGTSNGLTKVNRSDGELLHFDYRDGLQGNEFNKNAKYIDKNGIILLGGLNGLTIFDPKQIQKDTTFPEVYITSISLFQNDIPIDPKSNILPANPNYLDEIRFTQDPFILSINFGALNYFLPKKNQYAYMLDDFDKDWNYIQNARTATYTNLSPGKYQFKVKATNQDGLWTNEKHLVTLHILPKWYQSWWARVILTLSFLTAIVLSIRFRTEWLLHKKKRLENEIRERTAELEIQKTESSLTNNELIKQNEILKKSYELIQAQHEELIEINQKIENQQAEIEEKSFQLEKAHQDIKSTNKQLIDTNNNLEKLVSRRTSELQSTLQQLIKSDETLNTFLFRSSHDLREPITTLMGFAQLAKKESNNTEVKQLFNKLSEASHQMLRLLEKLRNTNLIFKIENRKEKINWKELFEDIKAQLNFTFPEHDAEIKIEVCLEKEFYSDIFLLKVIIYNLMENSLVFSSEKYEPKLEVNIYSEKNILFIKVSDNGEGIEKSIQNRIFDMFYRGSGNSIGNGLGLFMVQKAVKNLKGTISFHTKPGESTVFSIKIPIKKTAKLSKKIEFIL